MFVPPVVTEEAAGAAELLTVVLLLVVSALEAGIAEQSPAPTATNFIRSKALSMFSWQGCAQKFWLKLLEKALSCCCTLMLSS